MPYSRNLAFAEMGCAYVDDVMHDGADNISEHVTHRAMYGSRRVLFETVDDFHQAKYAARPLELREKCSTDPALNFSRYMHDGDLAAMFGMGNCGEMAACAFKFLIDGKDISDIALFQMYDGIDPMHTFLVLGVGSKPPFQQPFSLDMIPGGWSPTAVWCDPWRREWFTVSGGWTRRIRQICKQVDRRSQPELPGWQLVCTCYFAS